MRTTLLIGGAVLDGTGRGPERADVLIEDGLVRLVGALDRDPADARRADDLRILDVSGLCVAPGFVDAHSHGDADPLRAPQPAKLLQGVTTEVVGNCGLGVAPRVRGHLAEVDDFMGRFFPDMGATEISFADHLADTDRAGYLTNYAPLAAHGVLRMATVGASPRAMTAEKRVHLAELSADCLAAGALGISTGLVYPPGQFADPDELAALGTAVAAADAVYASHVRDEGPRRLQAVAEAIEVGRRTGARVQISHHKALGRSQWGSVEQSLALAAAARAEGVRVGFDMYPYTASSTTLLACLPAALRGLPAADLLAALDDPDVEAHLRAVLARDEPGNRIADSGGFDRVVVTGPVDRFAGRTLAQLADELGTDGTGALVTALRESGLHAGMINFAMDQADVDSVLADPHTCIGSDSETAPTVHPHPRGYGTFARILGHYVRERRVLALPEAVRRMTSLPAEVFGLSGVGMLRPGAVADIAVFDARTVRDRATYQDPTQPPVGVHHVFVHGLPAVENGRYTGVRAGRRLHPAARAAA